MNTYIVISNLYSYYRVYIANTLIKRCCNRAMNQRVIQGLSICCMVANKLKDKYPNEVMTIKDDTILYHQSKNRKIKGSIGSSYAYYTNTKPHRIIIKQKVLIERKCLRTKIKNQTDRVMLTGNFALIELMCHELAHHRTKGHAKGFKLKYHKFLNYMVNLLIDGKVYYEGMTV